MYCVFTRHCGCSSSDGRPGTHQHSDRCEERADGRISAAALGWSCRHPPAGESNGWYIIKVCILRLTSPVICVQGRGALQDIDQMSLFKPLCKFCASVRTVREIVPTLRTALAAAQSGTPGPVFIELPIDTLYPFHLVSKEFGVKNPPKGLVGKIVSWYPLHLSQLFFLYSLMLAFLFFLLLWNGKCLKLCYGLIPPPPPGTSITT